MIIHPANGSDCDNGKNLGDFEAKPLFSEKQAAQIGSLLNTDQS